MYKPGDHYVICDQCGFRFYNSEMRMQWNNIYACRACYDPKHPMLKPPKPLGESQSVAVNRPEKEDVFITDKITADDL